eukprot:TRINITY_DN80085_c0_g1_i1.p1 TRINITY_DN80085_c0_g1~~TRINITY_DN80085_c0_g1_i1.p1  ORF type:complete len:552 (+),score=131.13 TRINITY_DN80085_c0_g1_i1:45-1700(+)
MDVAALQTIGCAAADRPCPAAAAFVAPALLPLSSPVAPPRALHSSSASSERARNPRLDAGQRGTAFEAAAGVTACLAAAGVAAAAGQRHGNRRKARAGRVAACSALRAAKKDKEGAQVPSPTFDYAFWAENTEESQKNADKRRSNCNVAEVVRLYEEHKVARFQLKELQTERNAHSKKMKGKLEPDVRQKLIDEGKEIKERMTTLEEKVDALDSEMSDLAFEIPNITHPETPTGAEENAKVVRTHGTPRTNEAAGFQLKDHLEIGKAFGFFDFESGGKVSGQKFVYTRGAAALLEIALVQWAMHEAVKRGFEPVMPPDMVRSGVVAGCGFRPRDEATQIYEVADTDLCMAGTAEIPVAGIFMNETLVGDAAPQKLVAFGHAFRTEAGSSGSENRGMYRLHQFSKVELFAVTRGNIEESNKVFQEIAEFEEHLYTSLGLCFRILDMPSEELGAPAYRKFDMEAWMPGLQKWGEISSCSTCTDYQARRLNIRYKETYTQKGGEFAHTLNGTACAVPRMIISILETYQNEDGSVTVPEVLRPYMMGMEVLKPKA